MSATPPVLPCNAFGIVPRDGYYSQLQAPCLVSRMSEEIDTLIANGGGGGGGGGVGDLRLINNEGITLPVNNDILTTGTGGNVTVGDNNNSFSVQHLRSLSQFVVGNQIDASEYQSLQDALTAAASTPVPESTYNVVILQAGKTYAGSLVFTDNVVIQGQKGTLIQGNMQINANMQVILQDVNVFGAITHQGSALTCYNCILQNGASALMDVQGSLFASNSIFFAQTTDPVITLTSGVGSIVNLTSCDVINVGGGNTLFQSNGFNGSVYLKGNQFFGGPTRLLQRSIAIGNYFGTDHTVTLSLIDASGILSIDFLDNVLVGSLTILKDTSTDSRILVQGNDIRGVLVSIDISNNDAPGSNAVLPRVQFKNNTVWSADFTVGFTLNTTNNVVLVSNNSFGGAVSNNVTISGSPGQVQYVQNNFSDASLTFQDAIAYLDGNFIQNNSGTPINCIMTLGTPTNNYIANNFVLQPVSLVPTLIANLQNAVHTLNVLRNTFANFGGPLFTVALAGGSSFNSDGFNDNINTSPVGTAPSPLSVI